MIIGIWANEGLNDDEGSRSNAIAEIEANFDEAVRQVMSEDHHEEEEEIDPENPFFKQMYEGMEKLHTAKPQPSMDTETVEKIIEQEQEFSRYIDQS
jgi:hypothetical protein